jgi:hypothetical protein
MRSNQPLEKDLLADLHAWTIAMFDRPSCDSET